MPRRPLAFLLIAATLIPTSSQAIPPQDDASKLYAVYARKMKAAVQALKDCTFTLHRNEWIGDRMNGPQTQLVWYRAPMSFYMKWVTPTPGREVILDKGRYDDELVVNPGPYLPTLHLDPVGRLAMDGQRNPIFDLSMHSIVGIIIRDSEVVDAHPAWVPDVDDLGPRAVYGEAGRCFNARIPKDQDPSFYAHRVEICFSERTLLPLVIKSWDIAAGSMRLVEDYGYEKMQVNVGLTDAHFDVDNPEYGF
ncbi:MAG: DUF1571 domain-containing protein [Alphaproteobacteria bacterium]|nr:DUF1571 domain-containing protein [Alphaproteobacteria bacterium]